MSFHADDDKLDYPQAQRIVERYVRQRAGQRPRTTSVDVLKWSDYPNSHHNRKRVYDALSALCEPTEDNWAGRQVFALPEDSQ